MRFSDASLLSSDNLMLVLQKFSDADPANQKLPAYKFHICDRDGQRLGECTLRLGYSDRVYYGGNIGYGIDEPHRGHHYAEEACRILFRLALAHGMEYLYISCTPGNLPSYRTCERLGGTLLETAELPADNDMREKGLTQVCVFRFELSQEVQ
jgi:predicted acetyltransferase